jgi:hypothetical protein
VEKSSDNTTSIWLSHICKCIFLVYAVVIRTSNNEESGALATWELVVMTGRTSRVF